MPQAQVEWRAKWIWIEQPEQPGTVVAAFRRIFELPEKPAAARLLITADTFYRAWVNGSFAGWGPAGSAAGSATADIVHIGMALQPGRNVISVMAVFADTEPFLYEALAQAPRRGMARCRQTRPLR